MYKILNVRNIEKLGRKEKLPIIIWYYDVPKIVGAKHYLGRLTDKEYATIIEKYKKTIKNPILKFASKFGIIVL